MLPVGYGPLSFFLGRKKREGRAETRSQMERGGKRKQRVNRKSSSKGTVNGARGGEAEREVREKTKGGGNRTERKLFSCLVQEAKEVGGSKVARS